MARILDIVICTYNREELLVECVAALIQQSIPCEEWGIIIVNNAASSLSQDTKDVLSRSKCLTVVNESKAGLSYARNVGIKTSHAEWLAFLDDDAKAPSGYIENILNIIKEEKWDCFGGHIESWWRYGQPRWLSNNFGSKPLLSEHKKELKEQHNWGSNIIIKKSALNDVGNFPTYIGMRGDKLGYAAENIVQDQLRQAGYLIGYDPNLSIDHVVMKPKLQLAWHLKSAYATGRDGRSTYPNQYNVIGILKSAKNCISRPIKSLYHLAFSKNFYWENLILESLKPYYLIVGKLRSLVR